MKPVIPSVSLAFTAFTAFVAAAGIAQAAPLSFNAVADYDSTNNANTVDRTAAGNLATFAADLVTAFNNNLGGVINFDGTGTFNAQSGINAKYGTGLGKTLAIGTSSTYNVQFSSNIRALSGTENGGTGLFLLDPTAGNRFYTFTFGPITGGAPGEIVTQVGFTVLARNGGGTPTITATATFSDSSTASGSAAFTVTSTIPNGVEDTFYGFTAPAGKSIASITLDYGASGGDLRRGIDDLAFVTEVPASGGPYDTWATSKGLDGSSSREKGFSDDPDADGLGNGLEWILGGDPLVGGAAVLPTVTDSGANLVFTYQREDASVGASTQIVQWGATLAGWTNVTVGAVSSGPDGDGVTVNVSDNGVSPDTVAVSIPKSNAPSGKLFVRLKATNP